MLQIGPLSIPYQRLFLILAMLVLGATSELVAINKGNKKISGWGWNTGFLGLIAARVGFILNHLSDFLPSPLTMLYVWQGGFSLLWGIAGGLLYTLWFFRKSLRQLSSLTWPILGLSAVFLASQLLIPSANTAKPLTTLTLHTLENTPAELQSFVGKPMVVNVWATWCLPCRREMPMLHDMAQLNPDVTFLFINQGEDAQTVNSYFESVKITPEHVLLDPGQDYGQAMGVVGYPSTFFYNAQGLQVDASYGELSRALLSNHLQALITSQGKSP